ncbi:hypothetical protein DOTSEDRAFT_74503 [Dothistroma septosporum NZE10]|uniref:Uncharacterized protein n=1 Tax=Dothistroma septosporum (strain NZE10 / CBS 128990) TaxID=675120 RepID=N1PHD4_DOTSN|nr:hypothetical protein DOTSEDRAFT_74503 [Dothistroma septosporum NZE10]
MRLGTLVMYNLRARKSVSYQDCISLYFRVNARRVVHAELDFQQGGTRARSGEEFLHRRRRKVWKPVTSHRVGTAYHAGRLSHWYGGA